MTLHGACPAPRPLAGEHPQGLFSLPQHWGSRRPRSRPSHLMASLMFLFFSSVFKKIFCQGEPLGHQLLALGPSPCALLGWQEVVEAQGPEVEGEAFQSVFPSGSPTSQFPKLPGDRGLPHRAPGQGPPVLAPQALPRGSPLWQLTGDPRP